LTVICKKACILINVAYLKSKITIGKHEVLEGALGLVGAVGLEDMAKLKGMLAKLKRES
jgi:UDP-3-O-[3-hydroxymyristoyl] glucosamine N-acyltransferase